MKCIDRLFATHDRIFCNAIFIVRTCVPFLTQNVAICRDRTLSSRDSNEELLVVVAIKSKSDKINDNKRPRLGER